MSIEEAGERIAKRLARAGLCSRREAERWIAAGRVSLAGKVLTSPAVTVAPGRRSARRRQARAGARAARLWRYHKPAGLMTTHRDDRGRPTVFAKLPAELPRLVSVGRLDLNSEGLLLLTNDGGLARALELPSRGWIRRYKLGCTDSPIRRRWRGLNAASASTASPMARFAPRSSASRAAMPGSPSASPKARTARCAA